MIDTEKIGKNKEKYSLAYLTAKPFPHVVIKKLRDSKELGDSYSQIPTIENIFRDFYWDFVFASN